MACPNKNLQSWKDLEAEYGEARAQAAFDLNGEEIPTIAQARKLLPRIPLNDNTLEENMEAFTKGLGFDTQQHDELQSITGLDAISATDLINKVILYGTGAGEHHVAKETAYVALSMLGKKNKITTDLKHSITEIPNYQQIFDRYQQENPKLSKSKINELIVVDFLADAIKENWEVPRGSYQNRESEFWGIKGNSALEKKLKYILMKIMFAVKKFFNMSKLNAEEIQNLADDIAHNILTQNYQKFQTELAPDQQLINYEDTIKKDPKANEIVTNFKDLGLTLTGSLAIRKQGTLYRTSDETLHDLDFTVQNRVVRGDFAKLIKELQKKLDWAGEGEGQHFIIDKFLKDLKKDLTKFSFFRELLKVYPEFQITNAFDGRKDTGSFTVAGTIGVYKIDLFINTKEHEELDTQEMNFQDWQNVFAAKIRMGRAKDMLDFKFFKPFTLPTGKLAQMKGLRHFTFERTPPARVEESVFLQKEGESYSDIKLVEPERYTIPSTITDFTERYQNLAEKKAELEAQGARISRLDANGFSYQLQLTEEGAPTTKPDTYITKKIKGFIESLGGVIRHADQIIHNGRVVDANAMVDVVSRTIDVANGKEQEDTLPEEAAHVYVHWLPKNSKLLQDMLRDIRTRVEYKQTMSKYADDPLYQNEDGTVNEEKIAIEAIGKVISKAIVKQAKDKQAQSWWQRLLSWIKGVFKGKNYDSYNIAASDILGGKKANLDMKAMKEANMRGEVYLQIPQEKKDYVDKQLERPMTSQAQKDTVAVLRAQPVWLDEGIDPATGEERHDYKDKKLRIWNSTTFRIHGEFAGDANEYKLNALWGKDMDSILQGVIQNKSLSAIPTKTFSQDVREQAYKDMAWFLGQMTRDGEIAMTQVVVATAYDDTEDNRVAGSIDLLLIHKDGSVTVVDLKTSYKSMYESSYSKEYKPGVGSKLLGMIDPKTKVQMKFNKSTKYGVQVGAYAKMLELSGIRVRGTWLKNVWLHTNQEVDKDGVPIGEAFVEGYTDQEIHNKPLSQNKEKVNRVVPGEWTGKEAIPDPNPLHVEDKTTMEEIQSFSDAAMAELEERVTSLYQSTLTWRENMDRILGNIVFKVKGENLSQVDGLITMVEDELESGEGYSKAYTLFLQASREQLSKLVTYLTEQKDGKLVHAENPREFLAVAAKAAEYLATYEGFYHLEDFTTTAQNKMYKEVERLLRETAQGIKSAIEYTADKQVEQISVNPLIQETIAKGVLTTKGYTTAYTRENDVASITEMMGSLGGNTIADISLKLHSYAMETARRRTEATEAALDEAANEVVRLQGNKDYEWMKEMKDGKFTGQFVDNIGPNYRELREAADEDLFDPVTMKWLEYIDVDNSNGSKEDIAFNNKLWAAKQRHRIFMNAERIFVNKDGELDREDGKYHRYTDDFINERNLFMYPVMNKYGTVKWKFKTAKDLSAEIKQTLKDKYPGKSLEDSWRLNCKEWRERNYSYSPYTTVIVDKEGKPTGVTKRVTGDDAYFPKEHHVRVRLVASDGTKLASDKYIKLMSPVTPLDHARSDYYKLYQQTLKERTDKMTPDANFWFKKSNVPTLPGTVIHAMAQEGANKAAVFFNNMKPTIPTAGLAGGEETIAKKRVPVALMNSIQNIDRINTLNKELNKLIAAKDTMKPDAYKERYDLIEKLIKEESNKMKAEEIHPDINIGIKAWVAMADNYDAMSSIELELLNLQKKIQDMEFVQSEGKGPQRIVTGTASRTYKMFEYFLDNEFYHEDAFNKTLLDSVANKLMNATSASAIAFNVTGMVRNSVIAAINNGIESIGSDYFDRQEYRNTVKEFHTEYIPGLVKNTGQQKDAYGKKRAGSKYEWATNYFNMVKHAHDSTTGRVGWLEKMWGYKGYDRGEYMVQSEIGIAILKTIMMTGPKNETLSVYDALKWNENDGTCELKPGYTLTEKQAADITHRIWKTNERIHGNYRWKIQLEKYVMGRVALQFHKWVYPNFRQRYEKSRFDESLGGGMDVEGRYTTLWTFIKSLNELKSRTEAWDKLTKLQRNNLKKDMADVIYIAVLATAGYIVKRLAEGLDDDDPYLRKMANWLQYQADGGIQELSLFVPGWNAIEGYKLVKNPFAAMGSIEKYQKLLVDATKYPFREDKENRYRRGVYKGQLKVVKDIRDVFPILREVNQWYNLDANKNFYIP